MSGAQVIEVVIIDSDINDTDEAKGEPDVTVNGKILRMVQAVDGNWYGYFSDIVTAGVADETTIELGIGLDFGSVCDTDTAAVLGISEVPAAAADFFSDVSAVAVNSGDNVCTSTTYVSTNINVLRESKATKIMHWI